MKISKIISFLKQCFFTCVFVLSSLNLQAALYDRGNGMVYDSTQNITWLKDPNYAKTIGAGSSYDGTFEWAQAKQWVANLNYAGYSNWRLPSAHLNGTNFVCDGQSTTKCLGYYNGYYDYSYNNTRSELGHLFAELGNISDCYYWPDNRNYLGFGCSWLNLTFIDAATGLSVSFSENLYYSVPVWEEETYAPSSGSAWIFLKAVGKQVYQSKDSGAMAWAVHDGDIVNGDSDGDGLPDQVDNCPSIKNLNQLDADQDHLGDICDSNDDNDSFLDIYEVACGSDPFDPVSFCNWPDTDSDKVPDSSDNCPTVSNEDQLNIDDDSRGDACDSTPDGPDDDLDDVVNASDNCPLVSNSDQINTDGDSQGDACDENGSYVANLLKNSNGMLIGATGIMVDGVSYDVFFEDGSCKLLLNGCKQSVLAFNTYDMARDAAQALLDQVLIGAYDDSPASTAGCGANFCQILVPWNFYDGLIGAAVTSNNVDQNSDSNGVYARFDSGMDTTSDPYWSYSLWVKSSKRLANRFISSSLDGWILESTETSKTGGKLDVATQTLMVGDSAKNQEYRSVLSFDTSRLPDNAVILSASLQLVSKSTKGSVSSLGALTADIRKPYLGVNASLALNDFAAQVDKTSVVMLKKSGSSYKGNLNANGKSLINKKGTTQFRLHFAKDDDNDKKEDWLSFYSGNAVASKKPVLQVDYYVP